MQQVLVYTTAATPPAGSAPFYGRDLQSAMYQAQLADEAALFGSGTAAVVNSDIQTTQLSAPSGLAVAAVGTAGSTTYTYLLADVSNAGTLAPCTAVANSVGNATLSTTNYLQLSFTGIIGHTYNVYRSTAGGAPSTTGQIGTITVTNPNVAIQNNTAVPTVLTTAATPNVTANAVNPAGLPLTTTVTFNDTGLAATTVDIPTLNTTGAILAAGPIYGNGPILQGASVQTVTNSAGVTLTVANLSNALLIRAGSTGSAVTDTTPTAAALVAAFPGVKVNQAFTFMLRNTTGFNVVIGAGTGVTVTGATTATVNIRQFMGVFLNVTPGTESVTVYGGPVSAY